MKEARADGNWQRVSDRKRRQLHWEQIETAVRETAKRQDAFEQFVNRLSDAWNTLVERFNRIENRIDVLQLEGEFHNQYLVSLLPTPEDKAGYLNERQAFVIEGLKDKAEEKRLRTIHFSIWRMGQEISAAALVDQEIRDAAAAHGVQVLAREITAAAKCRPKREWEEKAA